MEEKDKSWSVDHPNVLARLEELDDTIFEAINGNAAALDRAAKKWQDVRGELGEALVEDSRMQYLRFAKSTWQDANNDPYVHFYKSFSAKAIIDLLANEPAGR